MTVAVRYLRLKEEIGERARLCGRSPDDVLLLAVSKGEPVEAIWSAYREGCRDFGESRVQEACRKIPLLPSDCRWHLIGTLQRNKVGRALALFHTLQSVDGVELARQLSRAGEARGEAVSVFLQVNTSGEASKRGLSREAWEQALPSLWRLSGLRIEGLMTLAPHTEDESAIRLCFRRLHACREAWRSLMREPEAFRHLSMGMSHDYPIAIEEGATCIRIGSALFGFPSTDPS